MSLSDWHRICHFFFDAQQARTLRGINKNLAKSEIFYKTEISLECLDMYHNRRSIIMDFVFLGIKCNIGYLLDQGQGQSDPERRPNNIVSRCHDLMY